MVRVFTMKRKEKRCTSVSQKSLLKCVLIQPTAEENDECRTFCIQSGYTAGGHGAVSKECSWFCSCHHLDDKQELFF